MSTLPYTDGDIPPTSPRRGSRRCNARIKGGKYCRLPAGYGTDHPGISFCARHGGNNEKELTAAGMRLAHHGIMDPDVKPGDIVELEPHNALIWAIWLSGGDVAYWNKQLQKADPDDIALVRALYKEHRTANREMRSAAKMALDAGLAERQVAMAERMAGILASFTESVMSQLALTEQQQEELPKIIERELLKLEAPGAPKMRPRPKMALTTHKVSDLMRDR